MPKFNKIKNKKFVYAALAGAALIVLIYIIFFRGGKSGNGILVAQRADFVNEVSVSGSVVAAQEVDLGFKKSGVIKRVLFDVGTGTNESSIVRSGTIIAEIDTKEALKDIHDAEVSLEIAKLDLEKLKLNNSSQNLSADLNQAYDDGFNAASDAFLDLSDIITGLEDVLDDSDLSYSTVSRSGSIARDFQDQAESLYSQAKSLFKTSRTNFRSLDRNSERSIIKEAINEIYNTTKTFADAVKSAKNLVDYMLDDTDDSSAYAALQSTLAEYTSTLNSHLSLLSSAKNDINDYEEAFSDTDLDIRDLELEVKRKENDLTDALRNLSDYRIVAPFDGVITKVDAKEGEVADANEPLVSMISSGTFQIESYMPEVNIALVKAGAEAKVTLDAYGEKDLFSAKVIAIDPAETIRDGVPTYKVTLQFESEDDRIKRGMTANVSIIVFSKENVIVVPGGVVFDRDGKKYIQVKDKKGVTEREVVLGDVSPLGQAEIISGLAEGEAVVLNPSPSSN